MGRITTFPLSLPNNLKVCDWYKPSCCGYQRIACLIPFCVILPAQNMEEISFVERQFLSILIRRCIVVECLNDLLWWDNGDCGFGSD